MGLLGVEVDVVAAVMLVVAVVGGALLAGKGRGWRGFLLRVVVIALSSTMVMSAVALHLNREFAWYSSTADVLGDGPNGDPGVPIVRDINPAKTRPALPKPGERLQEWLVADGPNGSVHRVMALLPKEYFDPAWAKREFPVLVAAHGYPGSPESWMSPRLDFVNQLDTLVASKTLRPTIVVIPQLLPDGADTECIYGPKGDTEMERWLADGLPRFVRRVVRSEAGPKNWAIIGYSFGAWCASMMTMLHPDRYGAAISLGGYFRPIYVSTPPYPVGGAIDRRYDLMRLSTSAKPPAVKLYVQTTLDDKVSSETSVPFTEHAKPPLKVTGSVFPTGGHSFNVWKAGVTPSLTWLAHEMPAFAGR